VEVRNVRRVASHPAFASRCGLWCGGDGRLAGHSEKKSPGRPTATRSVGPSTRQRRRLGPGRRSLWAVTVAGPGPSAAPRLANRPRASRLPIPTRPPLPRASNTHDLRLPARRLGHNGPVGRCAAAPSRACRTAGPRGPTRSGRAHSALLREGCPAETDWTGGPGTAMAHRNLGTAVHPQAPLPPQGGCSAAAVGGKHRHVSRLAVRRAAVSLQHMQAQVPPEVSLRRGCDRICVPLLHIRRRAARNTDQRTRLTLR
jgi:hypothetical protein